MLVPEIQFAPDTEIELTYPESTLVESKTTFRRRTLQIREYRDLIAEPLTPEEYLRRPLTQRSRYLLTAYDKDAKSWRQFYVGSSQEFLTDGRLRIALYKAGATTPTKIVSRSFEPTRRDRIELARTLKEMQQRDTFGMELRVIPDESRTLQCHAKEDSAVRQPKNRSPSIPQRPAMTANSPLPAFPF